MSTMLPTREVMERLGILSTKTLFRRRTDCRDPRTKTLRTFLEPGVHFFSLTPGSTRLIWDWEKTERAWKQALKLDSKEVA
jgi:hypothetical protein